MNEVFFKRPLFGSHLSLSFHTFSFFFIKQLFIYSPLYLPTVALFLSSLFLSSFCRRSFCSCAEVRRSRLRARECVELILSLGIITGTLTVLHTLSCPSPSHTLTCSWHPALRNRPAFSACVQITNTQNR